MLLLLRSVRFGARPELLEHSFDLVLKVLWLLKAELERIGDFLFLVLVLVEQDPKIEAP